MSRFTHPCPMSSFIAPHDGPRPRLLRAMLCHGLAGLTALLASAAICLSPSVHAQSPATPAAAAPNPGVLLAAASRTQPGAGAASPAAPVLTGATPLPGAVQGLSHEQLFALAGAWVMKEQQTPAEQIQWAALDSRVRIADCSNPLQFDYPFSGSRETVRVRCNQPKAWQLFLRLNNPPPPQAVAAQTAPPGRVMAPVMAQAATKTVVVTRQLLQRGTELTATMLEEVQRPTLGLDPLAIASLKDVERAEVVRDIPAGTVLRSYDIKRSLMVRKGQSAMLTVGQDGRGGGFQISVRVEAEQDGYLGEQIRLRNPESGRLITGVVTGPNAVKGI